jgi:hypothetical protein
MADGNVLWLLRKKVSNVVIESVCAVIMVIIAIAAVRILYVSYDTTAFDGTTVMILLQLFQTLILLMVIIVCLRMDDKKISTEFDHMMHKYHKKTK